MQTVPIIDGETGTDQSEFVQLDPGRWKIALSLASTNASESVSLQEKTTDDGDERTVSKSGAAVALTEAAPQIEYASGGELLAATPDDGSVAVTITATLIERGL